jgi:PAS domain S-box-containing protein
VEGAKVNRGDRRPGRWGRNDACGVSGEALYRKLFESVGVGVAFVGPEDGIIVGCNLAYAGILGSTPEGLQGRSFFEFLGEEQERKARQERELRLRGETSEYEIVVTTDGGEERRLLATGVPLYDERDHTYLGAAQTLVDVTERRRAEEAVPRASGSSAWPSKRRQWAWPSSTPTTVGGWRQTPGCAEYSGTAWHNFRPE